MAHCCLAWAPAGRSSTGSPSEETVADKRHHPWLMPAFGPTPTVESEPTAG